MPWIVALLGVVTLVTILLVASLSFRGHEPESAAASLPPLELPIPPAYPTPSATATPSPSASRSTASVRPSRTSARPSPQVPRATRTPSGVPSEQPALLDGAAMTATYRVRDADRNEVDAELLVENDTGRAEEWTVSLLFTGKVRSLRVTSGAGVAVSYRGDGRYELRGTSPLGSGADATLALHFTRYDRDTRVGGCTVNGSDCVLA